MDNEAVHNMLVSIQAHTKDHKATLIIGQARLQLEDLIAEKYPTLNDEERALPDKGKRTVAYKNRVKCTAHIAHLMVNRAWREEESQKNRASQLG